jgi:formylglycine-generating enzyme required for sulfatase activity
LRTHDVLSRARWRIHLRGSQRENEIKLDEFWVGKYPITNAQFGQFVQAEGYDNKDFWQEAIKEKYWSKGGFKGRWEDTPRKSPHDYGEPFTFPNHPVVGITWYEALAFTRWLNSLLFDISQQWTVTGGERNFREQMKIKKIFVALPTEEQWEKSARGTDGREYPWPGEFDPNKANTSETGIGTTSAAGCFPTGQSPYGVLDASGNVWEWVNGERNLRGGSFYSYSRDARCSFRFRNLPGYWYRLIGFRVVVSPDASLLNSGL